MKPATGAFVVLAGMIVAGCSATHTVAVTSYHAVTAPVRLVHRAIAGEPSATPAANSDVANPGQPIAAATPSPTPQYRSASESSGESSQPARQAQTAPKPSPLPSAPAVSKMPQFPVAHAVPGKAGLVYNPFDPNGALIDVSGYPSGTKVKDPDSQKIFIVP
jgi:hypothetical protein